MTFNRIVLVSFLSTALFACMSVPQDPNQVPVQQYSNDDAVVTGSVATDGYYLGDSYTVSAPANQKYYFDFAISQVHSEYMPSINAQARYLASHPSARVRLEGNTDLRGSREYNIGLGERRALAVAQVLRMNGAAKNQVAVVSYGKERPAALGQTEEAFKLNRRVDLVYEAK